MSTHALPRLHGRGAVLAVAAVLYVAVFVLRDTVGSPADGLTFLYVFPVVLVAIELGLAAGLAAALVAIGLFELWAASQAIEIGPLGYIVRMTIFGGVAVLCAQLATRVRRLTEQSERSFELSTDLLGTADPMGRLLRVNGAWERNLGWTAKELTAKPIVAFLHPDDRESAEGEVAQLLSGAVSEVTHVTRLASRNGGWHAVEWSLQRDPESEVVWVSGRDVTERVRGERARQEAEERFRVSFEHSDMGMAVVGVSGPDAGRIIECNDVLARLFEVDREQLLGTSSITGFADPADRQTLAADMERLLVGDLEILRREMRIVRGDGHVRWMHVTTSIVHDADGRPQYRLSQIQDIDDRKRSEERLRHLADHDVMSGLHNRRRWVAELEEELHSQADRGSRGAVLAIDLDNFKQVNDSAGHAVGDAVIAAVGKALSGRLRSADVAGRLGGDEFAVLLRRVDGESAVLVAHGIIDALSCELGELTHPAARAVTMSLGVALIDAEAPNGADRLMARADAAMYDAKRRGGGRVELAMPSSVPAGPASPVLPGPSRDAVPHPR